MLNVSEEAQAAPATPLLMALETQTHIHINKHTQTNKHTNKQTHTQTYNYTNTHATVNK